MKHRIATSLVIVLALGLAAAIVSVDADVISTSEWGDFLSDGCTKLDGNLVPPGAIIDAYDPQGVHCGTSTVSEAGSWGSMHVYGDDGLTEGIDEGASSGDRISFRINGVAATLTSGNNVWYVRVRRFICLESITPTAVELTSFTATRAGRAINLSWMTANEIDSVGFNLYRATREDGKRTKINAQIIPSELYPGSPSGAVYLYADTAVKEGKSYYYWLEDVDIYGHTEMHGPAVTQAE